VEIPDNVTHLCTAPCFSLNDVVCVDTCPKGYEISYNYKFCDVTNCSDIVPEGKTCPFPCLVKVLFFLNIFLCYNEVPCTAD
jgi:hypothetical protein